MYQGYRTFSHSGMCWATTTSGSSQVGSKSTAGTSTTIVVWYDWSRGVDTGNSCASAAPIAINANAVHSFAESGSTSLIASQLGKAAPPALRTRKPPAGGESPPNG